MCYSPLLFVDRVNAKNPERYEKKAIKPKKQNVYFFAHKKVIKPEKKSV
jgi:hypothetical protein